MEDQSLIEIIGREMDLVLPPGTTFDEMRQKLQAAINELIEKDFAQLVNILYRVDVNERKLKYLLQENVGEDAPVIIADLIIERQAEKIRARKEFTPRNDESMSDEEKW